jgi:hypothetical protein
MMDELTLMRSFRAERVRPNPAGRALARRALEARFEAEATSTFLAGDGATAGARTARDHAPRRRPSLGRALAAHRRLVAFVGATALAAVLAGVLVLSAGPTAQPASAAEVLHRTAAIAAAETGPGLFPDPDQLIYRKTEQLELQEWAPGEWTASYGGVVTSHPTTTYAGYVHSTEEAWMSNKRRGRQRIVLDKLSFLSAADRRAWKAAGSPLPGPFTGEAPAGGEEQALQIHRGVRDVEVLDGPGYGQFGKLPTEPEALRRAIERKQTGEGKVDDGQVIAELWDILEKANTSPALRAAVFNALAEEPGMGLDRSAEDLHGRAGYALSYENRKASEYQQGGIRTEYIFDPDTAAILGKREVLADPAERPWVKGLAAGTVLRDVAYLNRGIVDSTHERSAADSARATASSVSRSGSGGG